VFSAAARPQHPLGLWLKEIDGPAPRALTAPEPGMGDDLFHTYSVYARGTEGITDAYSMLDITPWGRQQEVEDSPPGWPQRPTYG